MTRTGRRRFLFVAWTALAAPMLGHAQQAPRVWRIGFLALRHIGPLETDYFGEFPRGMRELGYVEGRNLSIEWRSAEGRVEQLAGLAAGMVERRVDVIVAAGAQAVHAAQKATRTIPIVMGTAGDPVGSGFVKSLARPGGNITGLSDISSDVSTKLLDLLRSAVPKVSRVAVLINPDNSSHVTLLQNIRVAAQSVGVEIVPVMAHMPDEIQTAFAKVMQERANALVVAADAVFNQQSRQIADLAASRRLPTISGYWQFAEMGGLMSFGQNFGNNFRRAAAYVDRILRGAKPGELPVEQPTRVEFLVNRKTAQALGLNLPRDILFRADRVIE